MTKVTRSIDFNEYQKLFSRSGFTEIFLKDYWTTHDQVLTNLKSKIKTC